MRHSLAAVFVSMAITAGAMAQTPQPFPRPGDTQTPKKPAQPPPAQPPPAPKPPAPAAPPRASEPPQGAGAPPASEVGFPIYPAAQFLASYDAGRGQRYYLYGATASFADVVTYYRKELDERGTLIFKDPPTHMFEIGRFREEAMAFPPGVTVKDWTWGGSAGYLNPRQKTQPERFPTVVMIVPPPTGSAR